MFSGAGKNRGARREPFQPARAIARKMLCAYCGEVKVWPQDFRVSYYAECKDCYPAHKPKLLARVLARMLFWFHYLRLKVSR